MGEKLSLSEAAEIAGVTAGTMRMHVLRGKLPSSKPKGRLVIDSADLDAYLVSEYLKDALQSSAGQKPAIIYNKIVSAIAHGPEGARNAILKGLYARSPRA